MNELLYQLSEFFQKYLEENEEYQTLALMAQLVQCEYFASGRNACRYEPEFIRKFMQLDLDLPFYVRRAMEINKIVCVLVHSIAVQTNLLRQVGLIGQIKYFILDRLSAGCWPSGCQKCLLTSICLLRKDIQLSSTDLKKYQILPRLVAMTQDEGICQIAIKLLKTIWRAGTCRNALLRLGLVEKLKAMRLENPTPCADFLAEIAKDVERACF